MKSTFTFLFLVLFAVSYTGCKRKLDKLPNQNPETIITPESINLAGNDRLNSVVFLSWFGTDGDGYISGYEISLDNQNWVYTTQNDSIFSFTLSEGSDTTDIEFYVRAIDNEGLTDPTPAHLKVPLKNTPPVAFFVDKGFAPDSVNLVTTFRWGATDVDGDETIIKAYLKANQGAWLEIDVKESLISLVPKTTSNGVTDADVFYGSKELPLPLPLTGLNVGDTNVFYLKVIDFANAESDPDTSETVFVKPKTSDILFVTGLPQGPTGIYESTLNNTIAGYDVANYFLNGGEFQPGYWSPTFDLILDHYSTVILVSDESTFTNSVSGRKAVLLDFMAPSLQVFSNNGGKTMVATSFTKGQDISGIVGTFPIDSLSSSNGQARLYPDSTITSTLGIGFPDLGANVVLSGQSPFYMSIGAEETYIGHFTPVQGWSGPNTVGARRKDGNNNYYQYFFSVQLHKMDQNITDLEILFDQILNNDFNW